MIRSIALLLALLLAPLGVNAETHPFGWEDMFAMVRVSDAKPSPDGRWVLFSRKSYDVETDKGNSDLALVSIDGKVSRQLTFDAAVDVNGRWSRDGSTVYFLSNRSGSVQIWKMSLQGGEPQQVTELPLDLDGFELSPDGQRVLFWTGVFVDLDDLEATEKKLKEIEEDKVTGRIYDDLLYRHWDTWSDGRRSHLFVMSLAGQTPVDLMAGMDQDCPTKPFGGNEEVAWSPDGKLVAFVAKPSEGEAWHTNNQIYLVNADGRSKPECLTQDNQALDTQPVFSPDGRKLAWLAMERPGYESDRQHLVVMDLATRQKQHVTQKWDRSIDGLVWAPDGRSIYVTAGENARAKIFQVNLKTGQPQPLLEEGHVAGLSITPQGTLVFLRDRMVQPYEVFSFNKGKLTQISHLNDARLTQIRMSQPEEFWFNHDGRRLHGWLLKPVDFQEGKKYPLAFLIHGGPQGSWQDNFHYRWNPQFYAGAGYVAVTIDFRGSTGYGQDFVDAIGGNWGPGPYSDLMAGLHYVLGNYPFIDSKRMAALGASYGGYMVNWVAGQDHPFVCLVNHDGDFDLLSAYYTTEELWFPEWEMKGTPWEKEELYREHSPSRFVGRWKTPMLVIQGALDFRVVESEAFSTFTALQRRGIPSKFLYFPDENHWVLRPQNSRIWHGTVLKWLDQWTGTER